MQNTGGITASLPGRYASALFDLASESGGVTTVETDLDTLDAAIAGNADFAALLRNPQVSRGDATTVMEDIAGLLGLSDLTRKFIGVLAGNRRLSALPEMIRAFRVIAATARGEVTAEVASAHPLGEDQIEALRQKLEAREGRRVRLRASVDPELLGGLVVTIGSKRVDSSIRTRLNTLAQAMKG